jgi:hypothetical protein
MACDSDGTDIQLWNDDGVSERITTEDGRPISRENNLRLGRWVIALSMAVLLSRTLADPSLLGRVLKEEEHVSVPANIEMRPAGPMPSGVKESIVWNVGQGSSVPSVLLCRIAQRSTYQSL